MSKKKPVDPFDGDDDARISWNTGMLQLVMDGNRLGDAIYLVRCFSKNGKLKWESFFVDEEIATEHGRKWIEEDKRQTATVREFRIGADLLSIETEKPVTVPA